MTLNATEIVLKQYQQTGLYWVHVHYHAPAPSPVTNDGHINNRMAAPLDQALDTVAAACAQHNIVIDSTTWAYLERDFDLPIGLRHSAAEYTLLQRAAQRLGCIAHLPGGE